MAKMMARDLTYARVSGRGKNSPSARKALRIETLEKKFLTKLKMGRGPKKHMKRLNAPRHWMLDKLTGTWAPKPSSGPHKQRECLPLIVFLRNRLRYALTNKETKSIVMQRLIKVDGKVRTDVTYPAGFMGNLYK